MVDEPQTLCYNHPAPPFTPKCHLFSSHFPKRQLQNWQLNYRLLVPWESFHRRPLNVCVCVWTSSSRVYIKL